MRRRRHSRGPQWRRGGEAAAISDWQRWWSWDWMPIAVVETDLCIGCEQCASACPAGAVSLSSEGKAVVEESLCRGCGACVGVCPVGAVQMSAPARSHRS